MAENAAMPLPRSFRAAIPHHGLFIALFLFLLLPPSVARAGPTPVIQCAHGDIQIREPRTGRLIDAIYTFPAGSLSPVELDGGRYLLYAGIAGGMKTWDPRSGALLMELTSPPVVRIEISRDGRHIAAGTEKGLFLYRYRGYGRLELMEKLSEGLVSFSFSQNGQFLASRNDYVFDLRRYCLVKPAKMLLIEESCYSRQDHTCDRRRAVSNDGSILATADGGSETRQGETARGGKEVKTPSLKPSTLTYRLNNYGFVRSLDFSPSGSFLLVNTTLDGYEEIETKTGQLKMFFDDKGLSLGYSRSGGSFFIRGADRIREYDTPSCLLVRTSRLPGRTGGALPPLESPLGFSKFLVSSDEGLLICAGNDLWTWDLRNGRPSGIIKADAHRCSIPVSGKVARISGFGNAHSLNDYSFVSLPSGNILSSFREDAQETSLFSMDSRLYASLCSSSREKRDRYTLTVRDVATGSPLRSMEMGDAFYPCWHNYYHSDWPFRRGFTLFQNFQGLLFSPDRKTISLMDSRQGMVAWDIATGRKLSSRTIPAFRDKIPSLLSPCGRWGMERVDSGRAHESIRIWDMARGSLFAKAGGLEKNSTIRKMMVSPGGRWLILQHSDYTTTFLNLASRVFSRKCGYVAALSPDDRYFLFENLDKTMQVLDGPSLSPLHRLDERCPVNSGTFIRNSRILVCEGRHDGIMRLWDADSGRLRGSLAMFSSGNWVVWTPGGLYDASPGAGKYLAWREGRVLFDDRATRAALSRPGLLATLVGK